LKTFTRSLASLMLCSLFASPLVRADDCSDSLMAESCACRSDLRDGREQLKSSDKKSPTRSPLKVQRAKKMPSSPVPTEASAALAKVGPVHDH
jgi:hypothetical protein